MKKVIVGISGGVDSSVSAYLLKQQGYEVVGLFMKNWDESNESGSCVATEEYNDAVNVCDSIGIPLYTVNFVKEYWDRVFQEFLHELKQGHTPNPDILCNREIKFNAFYQKAKEIGADFLATGHYCRTEDGKLFKGKDLEKDQSYFLHAIEGSVLKNVLFPIGSFSKAEVRRLAKQANLPTYNKKDSTGICFIGKRNFKPFIKQYIPYHPGKFENTKGKVIGQHDGSAYYTIGQRKGLGVGGAGEAWFVVGKDVKRNVVIIEQGADHPALYSQSLTANQLSLISTQSLPPRCHAKIRYRGGSQPCSVKTLNDHQIQVRFEKPQRAITPRQSIVFYEGDECLGGAFIKKPYLDNQG